MLLHRYGGGVGQEAVRRILSMPFPMLVRLIGAAKRATEPRKRGGSRQQDEEIIKELEAKEAAIAAAQKAGLAPA